MKQVQRPDVQRAPGQVYACWSLRFDEHVLPEKEKWIARDIEGEFILSRAI
jgi:hypothetical protein